MHKEKNRKVYEILPKLPRDVSLAIRDFLGIYPFTIFEIHLRADSYQSINTDNGVYVLSEKSRFVECTVKPLRICEKELYDTILDFCDGSLYTHHAELKNGYIASGGIRIGVCGKGIYENGGMTGFYAYTSINIRFPHHVSSAADSLFEELDRYGADNVGGILVVSPPGMGKTTFLRSLAAGISGGFYDGGVYCAKSCCVVDERAEIYLPEAFRANLCDFITGIPKTQCISHLTRTMTPEYIFCDEIAGVKEARQILLAASHGICFAASIHGKTLEDIIRKQEIRSLIKNGVFSTVCELYADNGKRMCRIRKNIL